MAILGGGIVFLIGLLLFQTAVISRLTFLYGGADLFILFLSAWALQVKSTKNIEFALVSTALVSIVSALPFYIYLVAYLGVVGIAYYLKKRIWQAPILALAFTIIVGTIIEHGLTIIWIRLNGVALAVGQAVGIVTVPTILINLVLSIPVYVIISNIMGSLYTDESE